MWCRKEMLFRFQWQKLLEKLPFRQFFVSGYLLLITQIGYSYSWCSNLMYNDASCGISFAMLIIWFFLKKIWKIKILLDLPRYSSCLFGLQKLLRLINCLSSRWLKTTNCKMLHLNFSDFFRQSSVRDSPQQSANAEAFAETYLCFLVSPSAKKMPRQLNS